jgi:plasmid replication initiation protein
MLYYNGGDFMAKNKKEHIFDNAIVEKRNVLNEIHKNNMSLQELRFFSIYLSKINARDINTRVVRFSLDDFRKIMELGADINITHFRLVIRHLLQQIVEVPNESGYGYTAFQLFKECTLDKNEFGEWYVTIDAHDKALPLLFDFKNRYFTYELWNALQLKSANQIRMYEILKQYETLGKREISVAELRELLGIAPTEYPRWNNFKTRVLDSCQQALAENTDITYTYEKGKSGRGGKWLTIVFHIQKNNKHIDQLSLTEFIDKQNKIECDYEKQKTEIEYGGELANLLGSSACNDEFTVEQIRVLQDLVLKAIPSSDYIELCDYVSHKVHKMNLYDSRTKIKDRFAYLCKMIEKDL